MLFRSGNKGGNGEYKNNNHSGHNNGHHNGQNHHHHTGKRDVSHIQCFKCKKMGHYSTECPEMKTEEVVKANHVEKGHVNHVHVGRAYNEHNRVNGTLITNSL